MKRLILRYAGPVAEAKAAFAGARSLPGVKVIDASPRMLLVEVPARLARQLGKALPLWKIGEEKTIALPPQPKLRVRRSRGSSFRM